MSTSLGLSVASGVRTQEGGMEAGDGGGEGGGVCDGWGFDVDDVNIWAHATTPACQLWLWTRPVGGLTRLSSCLRPPLRPLLPRSNSQRPPPLPTGSEHPSILHEVELIRK